MSFHWEEKQETKTRDAPICDVCGEEIRQIGGGSFGPELECGCGIGAWYVKPIHFDSPLPALQNYVDPFYVDWERLGYQSLKGRAKTE